MTMTPSRETIIDLIEEIFERRGAESYLGEAVTMSEHMLQGAYLAEQSGADEELIVAALLHDIGHYTGEFGDDYIEKGQDNHHEKAAAAILAPFFSDRLVTPIREHVNAKRFMCVSDPAYMAKLSEASIATLNLQGGPMSKKEAEAFARHPQLGDIIQLRLWDEAGKVANRKTPDFAHYRPMIERCLI